VRRWIGLAVRQRLRARRHGWQNKETENKSRAEKAP
jgi:hypothetical protein